MLKSVGRMDTNGSSVKNPISQSRVAAMRRRYIQCSLADFSFSVTQQRGNAAYGAVWSIRTLRLSNANSMNGPRRATATQHLSTFHHTRFNFPSSLSLRHKATNVTHMLRKTLYAKKNSYRLQSKLVLQVQAL